MGCDHRDRTADQRPSRVDVFAVGMVGGRPGHGAAGPRRHEHPPDLRLLDARRLAGLRLRGTFRAALHVPGDERQPSSRRPPDSSPTPGMSAPGLPQFVVIDPDRKPDRQRTRPAPVVPHGRPTPITGSGSAVETNRLTVRTRRPCRVLVLEVPFIEAAPRPLLRIPGIRQPWQAGRLCGVLGDSNRSLHAPR